jgi:hypothetical protein
MSTRQRLIAGGSLALVVVIVVVIVVVSGGSTKTAAKKSGGPSTSIPVVAGDICPLTGLPAPGGAVPPRPALLVKVGNEPEGARPQSGLNEADIVFDTPAEGFVMRYIAVYQCGNASSIGPTRSVRWVDYHLAREFVDPILAFAGGINPNVDTVFSDKWIYAADLLTNGSSAAHRITTRVAPDNLYTSTAELYGFYSKRTDIPHPIFTYSTKVPAGATPATSAAIDFSYGTDVVWKWNAAGNDWLHTYSGTPDIDALTGQQVSTTNIVIQSVHYKIGPYIESTGGTGDVESQTLGTGPAWILRNGTAIKVTWHRKDLIAPTTFTDANGNTVDLAPGRTWVEITPDSVFSRVVVGTKA